MCGIVGYIGKRQAYPILIKGLKRLEYRGYDSAGVALVNDSDQLSIYKAKGKVSGLEAVAEKGDVTGVTGIAHTRWATHGVPSEANAHPHVSQSGHLTLVHNGIIENYATLREQLMERGYQFKSETDTEVLVQLIDYIMTTNNVNLATAVRGALNQVFGAYAIAVIDSRHPEQLIAARKSSPLAVGVVEDNSEFFLASDASPIAEYTMQIVYLNDEEMAIMECGKPLQVFNLNGEVADAVVKEVDVDLSMLDHEGFPHFMLKEIFDQPNVLKDCMRGRIIESPYSHQPEVLLSAVKNHRRELLQAKRIVIISCGTSWHAGLIGKQLIEHFCRVPVEVAYASEFRYSDPVIEPNDVVMAISQSGETADTLAAIRLAKEKGALIFGIVNSVGSSIARESDTGTYIHVGPEIGVASTKAFTGQLVVLTMIALALGMAKGTVRQDEYEETINELVAIPDKITKILEQNDKIHALSQKFTYAHNFLYLGRAWNYPVALEGALKLKEISYIHAEGYPAAEMKHGPIALIDAEMPVVFIATHHSLYQKNISNMQEVISRQGHIIAIVTEGDEEIKKMVDEVIEVPQTLACLAPLLSVIPLQLLSYHVAVAKGLNVDQPRNLAKSVTVE
ncbi:MAG: glutamine--fructose-6-phosphate transaminase (isomerizing) [Bacteroidales bacterium]|nr:glutamine--fructose-6-phosphate transaminase (isomerizing) [Bacteroidales bacterium]MCM1147949.1 glutamine--fructose-6-phosphate transaminase (isomerizing) [Bacteroidales bacterium]MCM1206873.1 glutamine--fructose-6-phosphate transaminase (isomerizing) [Bacillota bacterium]MCM1509506.1 glutamine--fructose-6-phosphate transaminase (isomerizing) [Clostridium sp.]